MTELTLIISLFLSWSFLGSLAWNYDQTNCMFLAGPAKWFIWFTLGVKYWIKNPPS